MKYIFESDCLYSLEEKSPCLHESQYLSQTTFKKDAKLYCKNTHLYSL